MESRSEFFRIAFESHSAVMLLVDPNSGLILEANKSAADFYGYSLNELRGMPIERINRLSPDQVKTKRLDALEKRQNTFIFEHTLAGGGTRTVEVHSSPIDWEDRQVLFSIITDITERKQTENALRESEARWQFALEGAGDGVWDWNIQTNLVFFSDRWKALIGFEPHEIGNTLDEWDSRVHQEDKDIIYAEIEKHFSGQISLYSSEHRVRCKNGSYKWILDRGKVIVRAEDGTPLRMIGTHTDITERKLAEQKLRESEERFHLLADSAPVLIWMSSTDALCTYFNKTALEFTGRTLEQELGNGWVANIHPEDFQKGMEVYLAAFNEHMPFTVEIRLRRADGEYRWVLDTGVPRFTTEGIFLGYIGSCIDITEMKKVEQELKTQRDFATQIINVMGQGLTVSNAEGDFEFVNPAYASLFGYTSGDLIGRKPIEVTHSEDRKDLQAQLEKRRQGITSTYASRLLRKDGSIAPVLITGVPRRDTDDNFAGTIAVITDLSRQKQIEDELRQIKRSLEEALAREQILANTDVLTGIYNRRYFFEVAENKIAVALRYSQPLAALMFDIDNFKRVNDAYGHTVGDSILKIVTQAARGELREADVLGRYGDDEFILLLPMTNAKHAYSLAERVRMKVAGLRIPSERGEISITLSLGIVELHHKEDRETAEEIFRRADVAMYAAKASGRNCTVILDTEWS